MNETLKNIATRLVEIYQEVEDDETIHELRKQDLLRWADEIEVIDPADEAEVEWARECLAAAEALQDLI